MQPQPQPQSIASKQLKIVLNHALFILEASMLSDFMNNCDFYFHLLFFTNFPSQKCPQLISIAIEVIVGMTNVLASVDRSSESGRHFCLLSFFVQWFPLSWNKPVGMWRKVFSVVMMEGCVSTSSYALSLPSHSHSCWVAYCANIHWSNSFQHISCTQQ